MPNTTGGKSYKKGKKGIHTKKKLNIIDFVTKKTPLLEEAKLYGRVLQRVGGNHIKIICADNKERLGYITGKMRGKVWLNPNDIVIVELQQVQGDEKGEIIKKNGNLVETGQRENKLNICNIIEKLDPEDVEMIKSINISRTTFLTGKRIKEKTIAEEYNDFIENTKDDKETIFSVVFSTNNSVVYQDEEVELGKETNKENKEEKKINY